MLLVCWTFLLYVRLIERENFVKIVLKNCFFSIKGIKISGFAESPVFHVWRSESVSLEADERFLRTVVEKVSLVCA